MFSYFAPVVATVTEYYGQEVRDIMEKEMGIKVFSYEKNRKCRHLNCDLFQRYFYTNNCEEITKYLDSLPGTTAFVPFQTSDALLDFLFRSTHKYKLFQNPVIVQNYFDHKPRLTWRANEIGIPMPPDAAMMLFGDATHQKLVDSYGDSYVIQVPLSAAGAGTYFIHKEEDFDEVVEGQKKAVGDYFAKTQIKITPFLSGPSLNCTGCVCNGEVALSPPDIQIVGDPHMVSQRGQYIGSDFALNAFDSNLRQEMLDIVTHVGKWLGSHAYRGNFGVDFLTTVDANGKVDALFVSEVNARLVGESQYMADFEVMKDIVPLPFFHLAEYLELDIKPKDIQAYNEELPDLEGSAILIYKREKGCFKASGNLTCGVYKLNDGKLERLRDGINLSDTKSDEEFVITNGVPTDDVVIGHPEHGDGEVFLLYVLTRQSIVNPDDWRYVNDKWRGITDIVRDAVELTECEPQPLGDHV
ncbi:MAG: hypothetical protein JKX97_02035 [Candidatus Lindowbacteria bacterium]|nr:hypothetical protein [Candidatus Lindowbacteria bacterium]